MEYGPLCSRLKQVSFHSCLILTWHANALEPSPPVNAGTVVHAGGGVALVDVDLAARAGEARGAVATVGAGGIDANAVVLARGAWNGGNRI